GRGSRHICQPDWALWWTSRSLLGSCAGNEAVEGRCLRRAGDRHILLGGSGRIADDLSNEVTGCCFSLATAESESQAVCQLVEPRRKRFLVNQQQPAARKHQAACFAARRLTTNSRAAATMMAAGISPRRA